MSVMSRSLTLSRERRRLAHVVLPTCFGGKDGRRQRVDLGFVRLDVEVGVLGLL